MLLTWTFYIYLNDIMAEVSYVWIYKFLEINIYLKPYGLKGNSLYYTYLDSIYKATFDFKEWLGKSYSVITIALKLILMKSIGNYVRLKRWYAYICI